MRVCAHFWETGTRLPTNDADAAARIMLDVRMWKRIKAKLINKGKLHVAEDGVFNPRAETELGKAIKASKGDATGEGVGAARGSFDGQQEDGRNSLEGRDASKNAVDIGTKSTRSQGEVSENFAKNANDFNGAKNDLRLKTKEREVREEKEVLPVRTESRPADGPNEIAGLNGSTAEIVEGVAKLLNGMAPDYVSAKRMISSNVSIYGAHAVRDGYAELMADIADNKVRVPSYKALLGYFKTASERQRSDQNRPRASSNQPTVSELLRRKREQEIAA